jgi:transposase|nr:transposase [Rhizobium ruizarguesonis]
MARRSCGVCASLATLGASICKKIKGRKRHIVVDTLGLMVGLVVHSADIQDRDGAPAVLKTILKRWPWLRHIFADGGYAGPKLKGALQKIAKFTLQIVKRTDTAKGFEVLPRRWVVERTFAWLGRLRISLNWDSGFRKSRTSVSLSRGQRMRSISGCLVSVTGD